MYNISHKREGERFLKKFILIGVMAVFAHPVLALSWQDALSLGAQNSNDIKSAEKQLDASKWNYYKAYSNYLPQISGSMGDGQSSGSSGITNSFSYGLNARLSLFSGLSNYYNVQSNFVGFQSDIAGLQNTQANYFYTIRADYINLVLAQDNLALQKKILDSRQRNAKMIKLLYNSGKEDMGSYLRTEAQVYDAQKSVALAERDIDIARFKLSQDLNAAVSAAEGTFEAPVIREIDIDQLTQSSPAYQIAKNQLDLAEITKKSTVSEFLPSVSLSGNYSKSGSSWPPDSSSKSLTLSLSYLFFPGGANIADAAINSSKYEKAKQDFEKNKKDIAYSIKLAHYNLKNSLDNYTVQKKYLNAAEERAKIAQAQYLNGLTTYFDWDSIQNDYINYQKGEISAKRTALLAEAAFYKSYGGWVK